MFALGLLVAMGVQAVAVPLDRLNELVPDPGPVRQSGVTHPMNAFGRAVAVDGDVLVIGSMDEEAEGSSSGAAYIFSRIGRSWVRQQKLLVGEAGYSALGESAAISGDTIAVGAYLADGTGAVYVYVRDGASWSLQQKVIAQDATAGDRFGDGLALDEDRLAVGAPYADGTGAVYVFERAGDVWSQQDKFASSDVAQNDRFGKTLALQGDELVVGSPLQDNGNANGSFNAGAVYVFNWSGASWDEQQKLVGSDIGYEDSFGEYIDIDADLLAIGSKHGGALGHDGSMGHIFRRGDASWVEEAELLIVPETNDTPRGISVSGNRVAAGAFTSKAYLFDFVDGEWLRSGITAQQGFLKPATVALDDETLVVGIEDGGSHDDPGIAFVHAVKGEAFVTPVEAGVLAATAWDSETARYYSHQLSAYGGRLARIPAGTDPIRGSQPVGDVNLNGAGDLAFLSVSAAGNVTARVKDGLSGELISAVSFETAYRPQFMQIIPDITGDFDPVPELAVLGIDGAGLVRVQTKDAVSGSLVSKINFDKNFSPMALVVSDDISGNGISELVVVGVDAAGRVRSQIKDAQTGEIVGFVWFDRNYRPAMVAGIDTDGSGLADAVAVLGENASGVIRAQVKALSTGDRLGLVRFENGYEPIGLQAVADINSSGVPELALLQRAANGVVRVQVKDAFSGQLVSVVGFSSLHTPLSLGVSTDLVNNPVPDLGYFGQAQDGSFLLQVKDALSGHLISRTEFD